MVTSADYGGKAAATICSGLQDMSTELDVIGKLTATLELILQAMVTRQGAEGGTLYLYHDGHLQLAATHCDGLELSAINRELVDREIEPERDSLVALVARTGRTMVLHETSDSSLGGPLRIERDFDALTGRRTISAMAMRLDRSDGQPVGVLKLVNRLGPGEQVLPFSTVDRPDVRALAELATVAIDKSQEHERMRWKHMETILRLSAAAELRAGNMFGHVRRLSRISTIIAKSLDLAPGQTDLIRYASPMHDIGKTRLPDAVVAKSGRLSSDEHHIMRKHTIIGAQILTGLRGDVLEMARDITLSHHERWNGSGYPHGQAGEDIPLPGRVVAVADTFDALVTERSWRSSCPIGMALETISAEGETLFDPDVTRAFLQAEDHVRQVYRAAA